MNLVEKYKKNLLTKEESERIANECFLDHNFKLWWDSEIGKGAGDYYSKPAFEMTIDGVEW